MKKVNLVYLEDIIKSIKLIEQYLSGVDFKNFENDHEKQDAVIRRFLVIGEASRRLEASFRDTYEQIPWKKIVGLRNILIHEYDGVELDDVWKVYEDGELRVLKQQIEELIKLVG